MKNNYFLQTEKKQISTLFFYLKLLVYFLFLNVKKKIKNFNTLIKKNENLINY